MNPVQTYLAQSKTEDLKDYIEVFKMNGDYRIRGLALAAEQRLQDGDEENARTWLGWAASKLDD